MSDQAEQTFIKTFLNTISTQPVTYNDDYQQPPENWLRRVPVLPIDVPAPPERKQEASTSSASFSLTFKSLKPPASFTLSVKPTDSVASIKTQLASQPSAPPADAQRLLLKGKALADNKLLKEYSVKDGDTVNLMVKPGVDWDPSKPTTPAATMASSAPVPNVTLSKATLPPLSGDAKPARKHQRIPSVVLSPSADDLPSGGSGDVVLSLDTAALENQFQPERSTYQGIIAKPEFWDRLHAFLQNEFATESDANQAFEDFLCAVKGAVTPHEIAKIRDVVGVIGMAGT